MADGVVDSSKPVGPGADLPANLQQVRDQFAQIVIHIANTTDAHGIAAMSALLNLFVAEVAAARGTRAGLLQRLDMALNPDGTLRSSVTLNNGSEWVDPQLAPGKTDSYTVTVPGNHTDLFLQYRRVQISDGVSVNYGLIKGSTYNGSTTTSIQLYDAVVMDNPTSLKYGFVTPGPNPASSLDSRVMAFTQTPYGAF
jgi:hypothetical protein